VSKAEDYRLKATACEQGASASRDPEIKAQLMELARRWRQMAKDIERITEYFRLQ
jgi:hypothetical protein